ncbi:hypothetical protein ZIOFF_072921 [Zingiber officinale]|uniref:Nucleotidyl transferase domain-containing protein n=1 Tax=Zingiber officinale TaxID=94328 RepID=A0A8J5BZG2_ZINOF|nr:hypothetical protein ZIOFF_072921 [Zingiber officinale]
MAEAGVQIQAFQTLTLLPSNIVVKLNTESAHVYEASSILTGGRATAQKKGQRVDDSEVVARVPFQAVFLADSFNLRFRPITLERPKVLLPLVNVPMIEYTLSWLDSVGVEEVFVFFCSHSQQVKDYLKESEWTKPTSRFSVTKSHDAISAGDALRVIYEKSVIHGDFVLISGDTISNLNLAQVLREHKERKKKDPLAWLKEASEEEDEDDK